MKIVCVGGGPAGLYFSILMKRANPAHEITVLERNRFDDTFGFGVVFSDATLENLAAADAATYRAITDRFSHWDNVDIHYGGELISSIGHGFSGDRRIELIVLVRSQQVYPMVL